MLRVPEAEEIAGLDLADFSLRGYPEYSIIEQEQSNGRAASSIAPVAPGTPQNQGDWLMSASPFTTIEEFNGAADGPTEGALYTFAQNPTLNNVALLVAVGLFVWFIVSAYATHHEVPPIDKSLSRLSSFIIVGCLSLVAADHQSSSCPGKPMRTEQAIISHRSPSQLGFLSVLGLGLPTISRQKSKRRRRRYRSVGGG